MGLTGAAGPIGPAGGNGEVELVTCQPVSGKLSHGHSKAHGKVTHCTTKLVPGPVKFTTTAAATRVVLSRGGTIEATGIASGRRGHTMLLVSARQRLKGGRYTLALTGLHGERSVSTVTLG
jgi:hypothetical protein